MSVDVQQEANNNEEKLKRKKNESRKLWTLTNHIYSHQHGVVIHFVILKCM